MDIIAWIGLSQALFSGLLTLTKNNKSVSDRLLSALLFLLAIEFLTFGIESKVFPNFFFLTNSFLLFNPALYLYILSLTKPGFSIKPVQLLHLLPYLFFKISAWAIKEPQQYITFFETNSTFWFRVLFGVTGLVSWGIYLTLSGISIKRHRQIVKNEFSTIDTFKKVGWLLFIVTTYIIYSIAVLLWGILNILFYDTQLITVFNYSALLFFVYIFSFYGLKQRPLFLSKPVINERYKNPVLSEKVAISIEKQITKLFEKERPYLNPELNMQMLSDVMNLPKHHITEVLNGYMGKNFFQFVNEHRIEMVKKMLLDPKNPYSIEAIGYECGFNSKSTFFSVFKKFTGVTPVSFKENFYKNMDKSN